MNIPLKMRRLKDIFRMKNYGINSSVMTHFGAAIMMDKTKENQRKAELKLQQVQINEALAKIKNKLIIMSGKGGVGKSTVAVNSAVVLSEKGYKVGLMDIDFHGPNTLKMLNLENKKLLSEKQNIIPLKYSDNLKVISMAAMLETQDTAVIWRGPLKIGVIKQFIANVKWDDLDWLVIDSPPGTGDEPLTVAQVIKGAKTVIVTTPQEVSLMDVRKSVNFSNQLNMPIIGIIENMSGLICPYCHKKIDIFKAGGGKKFAEDIKLNFLGAIPFEKKIMESGDSGIPYLTKFQGSISGKIFLEIVDKIIKKTKERH